MTQELKIFDIFVLLATLNSYHTIQILYTLYKYYFNPIGFENTFSGSLIKFSENS